MSVTARIMITSGPDRGKVFELTEELVNIGNGADNEVALSDALIGDYQASITCRGGRYAIYTPLDRVVEVDGSAIPAKRWVWLPTSARVRVSEQTAFQFSYQPDRAVQPVDDLDQMDSPEGDTFPPTPTTKSSRAAREGRSQRQRSAKKKRNVARFITDQPGDALVSLGEDGQLPELTLTESQDRKSLDQRNKAPNSALAYAAVAFSVCCSIAILFIESDPAASTVKQKTQSRRSIQDFFGNTDSELKPYQRRLRDARLAYSRNDRTTERRAYRRVLGLLNSEDNQRKYEDIAGPYSGLTGDPDRDEQLRELIAILLSD